MKRIIILFLLLIFSLLLFSCDNLDNGNGQPFDPMESSIFKIADVKNARALDNLEVKAGASESYRTIATLNKGDVVRVLASIDNWYVIRLENYQIGCIDSTKTEPVVLNNRQAKRPLPTQPERPTRNTEDKPVENLPEQRERSELSADRRPAALEQPVNDRTTETEGQEEPTPSVENVDTGQETQLINLVNEERSKNGLPALQRDPELTGVARIKAQDMIDNNYFSHNSPTYGSPFDMMDEFGIDYQYAGENLANNTGVNKAHTALMNSSGHRKNILNPNFTHIGVGIKKAEQGYIYVEMFIGVPR